MKNSIYSILKDPPKKCLIETTQLFGIPKFTIIDVQTAAAKNLALKIKSAILNQSYKWSLKKQFVVEIEGEKISLQNNSQLELAIAVKFLLDTEQIELKEYKKIICVGSVNIHGKISECDVDTSISQEDELWIGAFNEFDLPQNYCNIKKLADLKKLKIEKRPESLAHKNFSYDDLTFMEALVAHGQHNCIYFSNDILHLKKSFEKINACLGDRVMSKSTRQIQPQYIESPKSLSICFNKYKKEFLLLSDFIFSKEHLQEKFFSYVERNKVNFVMAFSLCPCGKAQLGKPKKCGLSLYRCRSKIEKLSIKSLSFFDLVFTNYNTDKKIKPENLKNAVILQEKRGQKKPNSFCSFDELHSTLSDEAKSLIYLPNDFGLKRQTSLLAVARTIADLNKNEFIETDHIDQSMDLSFNRFKLLINSF